MSGANGRMVATPCDGFVNNVSYGVWFIAAGGSGIWLNLGKTRAFTSRSHAQQELCNEAGHLSGGPKGGPYKYHAGGACKPQHYDDWWCDAALLLGLDSIQIQSASYIKHQSHQHRMQTEIVYCRHSKPVCGVCPIGLPLRTGRNASIPCECDDKVDILNCGGLRTTPCADADSGLREGPHWKGLADWASAQTPVAGRAAGA